MLFYLLFGFKASFMWNPCEEARHEFAARDKKHEIRLEVRLQFL